MTHPKPTPNSQARPSLCLRCSLVGLVMLAVVGINLFPHRANIFRKYQDLAQAKLSTMSLEEKIAQVLLVRYPAANGADILRQYQFGGYLFFAPDFADKTTAQVQAMTADLQKVAKIPILTAVDEEGGTVVRVSSNPKLSSAPFLSPSQLYAKGGFELIREDTVKKSQLLYSLGLNLNLAPVVDVSTNSTDYMFSRSLGQDTRLTSRYAQTVIHASQGTGVSYTLKHFPGYGDNSDTHTSSSVDRRTIKQLLQTDLPPFRAGIHAGAEAVLVSHNIVSSLDAQNPASLSPQVHQLLRDYLGFTGVIITDDISMGALANISNTAPRALLAGNDLIITSDYQTSIDQIRAALRSQTLTESDLDVHVFRILAWKYYKGMITG